MCRYLSADIHTHTHKALAFFSLLLSLALFLLLSLSPWPSALFSQTVFVALLVSLSLSLSISRSLSHSLALSLSLSCSPCIFIVLSQVLIDDDKEGGKAFNLLKHMPQSFIERRALANMHPQKEFQVYSVPQTS